MSEALDPQAAEVLRFWFGDTPGPRAEWFRKDPAFDALIRERHGALVARALAGSLTDWAAQADGALARVLLLDQFTRNIHRGTPLAFAGDALARAQAQAMVASGQDRALPPVRRAFVYLPFEHAEDRVLQQQSVALHTALARDDPALAEQLDYALRHAAIVERFGRFPHRNAILGRASTPEEIAFLAQPGSGF